MEDRDGILVNDVHSRLNATRVARICRPQDIGALRTLVRDAADAGERMCVCGGRHAMGAQQFAAGAVLIDMTAMNRCLGFDAARGLIEIEAGADWPAVIEHVHQSQAPDQAHWGIRQKQTGADALSLGGAVAANVHGRGLKMRPFVDDVEALQLITADAEVITCSRECNAELFRLVVGGYGLFGVVASIQLRLGRRMKLRRLVDILDIDDAIPAVRRRAQEGCVYGDFQYAIDPNDSSFLRRGVCACYTSVDGNTPVSDAAADLSRDRWVALLKLAHTDKRQAFEQYSAHYLSTHGRVYWSDTMQLSTYLPTYDQFLRETRGPAEDESLMIGELNVPPEHLPEFLSRSRQALRDTGVEDIYGTIRSIRQDDATFLPWARRDYACVIFNLRTAHTPSGVARTSAAFQRLQDAAIGLDGSFYLTYHRFITRAQLQAAYPQFGQFLQLKRAYDPAERFVSDWYWHFKRLLNLRN
jgi:FAD/FMN-containing dehydrogenase